ncbi:contact-dependent growth inhibition system immunity protein [Pectobacterium parmentieri]|uniref:contact-dependent growth inhibition system immunity protein n=1 Tax=Pectobacterium parmentieri TaxID=1905730 RepID=UPI0018E0D21C|nr:contact-dependent growth inhibition system immunity protein [Pectobacterium parmentieri]QQA75783.1 CdiI family contact-dependent growth inhibition immunity protein [Pectobacterium parmentieri]
MQKYSSIVYEFGDKYFIVPRSRQSKNMAESPSENVALTAVLPTNVDITTLGKEALTAIDNYGVVDPAYDPWELKELRKQLCGWVGARSYTGLIKNCRIVLLYKDFDEEKIKVIPFDNHNIKAWESMMNDEIIVLPIDATIDDIGAAIDKAFSISTYHPERKNK